MTLETTGFVLGHFQIWRSYQAICSAGTFETLVTPADWALAKLTRELNLKRRAKEVSRSFSGCSWSTSGHCFQCLPLPFRLCLFSTASARSEYLCRGNGKFHMVAHANHGPWRSRLALRNLTSAYQRQCTTSVSTFWRTSSTSRRYLHQATKKCSCL